MIRSLVRFVHERFPVVVSVPLAVAVAGGARPLEGWRCLVRTSLACWCFLLSARVLDDLADLELDRVRKPHRGLVNGQIDAGSVRAAGLGAWLLAVGALAPSGVRGVAALLAASVTSLSYYGVRQLLPASLKPFWLNAPYIALVLLVPVASASSSVVDVSLALFVWLAVVAHDFAHSIESTDQPHQPSGLSTRAHWQLGFACYLSALLVAAWFVRQSGDRIFTVSLAVLSPWLLLLLARLAKQPNAARAARIYVPGGLFFILPLLSRLGAKLLG